MAACTNCHEERCIAATLDRRRFSPLMVAQADLECERAARQAAERELIAVDGLRADIERRIESMASQRDAAHQRATEAETYEADITGMDWKARADALAEALMAAAHRDRDLCRLAARLAECAAAFLRVFPEDSITTESLAAWDAWEDNGDYSALAAHRRGA